MPPSTSTARSWPRRADWAGWLGWAAALGIVAWSPFSGGPRVPSAILGVLGLWLLARAPRETLARPAVRRWLLVFACLWLPALLSLAGTVDAGSSNKVVAVLALYALTGVGLVACLAEPRRRELLQVALSLVLLAWVLDSYVQFVFGVDLIGVPMPAEGRVVGFFGDNLRQALILAALSPLPLWWLAARGLLPAAAAYLALAGVVVLSGVRGAWVITLLVGAAFLWHERRRVRWRWLLAGAVLVVLVASQSDLVGRKLAQTTAIAEPTFEQLDRALGHRLTIWETALAMLADRPLTGVGVGAFDEAYPRYSTRPDDPFRPEAEGYLMPVYHAHHLWVSAAAERGLPGLLGLALIAWLCVRWYLRADAVRRDAARPAGVALAAVAFPVNSQPILFTNWWLPIMMLAMGLFLAALSPDDRGGGAMGTTP